MFAKNRKDKETTITRTFEFKLRVNRKFVLRCEEVLLECQRHYNNALEDRAYQYKLTGKGTNFKKQSQELTAAREEYPDWFKGLGRKIQEAVLKRADKTFKAFFKRCAEKKAVLRKGKVGYPRFVRHSKSSVRSGERFCRSPNGFRPFVPT